MNGTETTSGKETIRGAVMSSNATWDPGYLTGKITVTIMDTNPSSTTTNTEVTDTEEAEMEEGEVRIIRKKSPNGSPVDQRLKMK
jgi:hypothetical protein